MKWNWNTKEIKRRFSWMKKKLKQKPSWTYFWIKSNSIYVYLCCLNSNERWAQLAKWVRKYAFVCLHCLFSYFIFPLNLHIFSVLQLFFFFEFLWAGFRMVLPTLLPMLSRQWFIALCILKYKGITLYKWYQVSHAFFSIRSLSFVLV